MYLGLGMGVLLGWYYQSRRNISGTWENEVAEPMYLHQWRFDPSQLTITQGGKEFSGTIQANHIEVNTSEGPRRGWLDTQHLITWENGMTWKK